MEVGFSSLGTVASLVSMHGSNLSMYAMASLNKSGTRGKDQGGIPELPVCGKPPRGASLSGFCALCAPGTFAPDLGLVAKSGA